jgi:hypothetical protein
MYKENTPMDIPAGIAAQMAMTRQNIALSVIKSSANQDQAIASILEQAVQSAPVGGSRGTNVNFSA